MIRLDKLQEADFAIFKNWINNEDELLQFAGPIFTYPITDHQLLDYIYDHRRISYKVVLTATNEMIGHCELNLENALPRLSRILVGNEELRNKGYGKLIVNEILRIFFNELGYESADLNVFEWNDAAIKCYKKIGFQFKDGLEVEYLHKGKIWRSRNMVINKQTWKQVNCLGD